MPPEPQPWTTLALSDTLSLKLKNLDPTATYRVTDESGQSSIHPGENLLTTGLPITLLPLTSARYRLHRLSPGDPE